MGRFVTFLERIALMDGVVSVQLAVAMEYVDSIRTPFLLRNANFYQITVKFT